MYMSMFNFIKEGVVRTPQPTSILFFYEGVIRRSQPMGLLKNYDNISIENY